MRVSTIACIQIQDHSATSALNPSGSDFRVSKFPTQTLCKGDNSLHSHIKVSYWLHALWSQYTKFLSQHCAGCLDVGLESGDSMPMSKWILVATQRGEWAYFSLKNSPAHCTQISVYCNTHSSKAYYYYSLSEQEQSLWVSSFATRIFSFIYTKRVLKAVKIVARLVAIAECISMRIWVSDLVSSRNVHGDICVSHTSECWSSIPVLLATRIEWDLETRGWVNLRSPRYAKLEALKTTVQSLDLTWILFFCCTNSKQFSSRCHCSYVFNSSIPIHLPVNVMLT